MPTTPNSKLPYPASTDTADVPRDIQNLAVALDELAYAQITASVNITATTAATANTIVTAPAVTFDGVAAAIVWFACPYWAVPQTANLSGILDLWDGSTDLGVFAQMTNPSSTGGIGLPMLAARRIVPSAGSHTFSVRGFVTSAATSVINAGAGTIGAYSPAYIRITRA